MLRNTVIILTSKNLSYIKGVQQTIFYQMIISAIQKKEFIDYVYSFYGSYDAIYPLHHIVTNQKLSKQIIKMAVNVYENTINFRGSDTFTWGDGDSIDRERVRNILENDFLFKEVQK